MTQPPLVIIGGLSYLPVPNDRGVHTLSIKIYEGQSINLYESFKYASAVMTTYQLGLSFDYATTDPKTGKQYILQSIRDCRQVGSDLFIRANRNFSDGSTIYYKVSEFELTMH